jgi:hypothetical protein
MQNTLEIENQILLTCARSKLDEASRNRLVSLTKNDICWDSLVCLAGHHKLLPLLYKHLSAVCSENIPNIIEERLKQFYRLNSIHNLERFSALIQVTQLLEEYCINVVSIKGPLYTLQYFDDISLRSFYDIDIIVAKKHFQKSILLLKSNGYDFYPKNIPEQYFLKFATLHHHARLVNERGTMVEVHWRLSSHYESITDIERISNYIKNISFYGTNFITLSPEMLIVYLSIHAQIHCWQKYDYLMCIAEVINNAEDMDWKVVFSFAKKLRVEKILLFSISMACDLLNANSDNIDLGRAKYHEKYSNSIINHQKNWQLINSYVVKKHEDGVEPLKIIYPLKLQLINSIQRIAKRFYLQYFLPSEVDYLKFPVPYRIHFIYYITRPSLKIQRLITKFFTKRFVGIL